jgi:hypothetical protein
MKWLMLIWTGLVGYGLYWNLSQNPMPPPDEQAAGAGWVLGLFFVLTLHLVVWLLGALPLYFITRMFQRREPENTTTPDRASVPRALKTIPG